MKRPWDAAGPPLRIIGTSDEARSTTSMPRAELGIHGLNRWAVNCLEMSRKRGVHAASNARKVLGAVELTTKTEPTPMIFWFWPRPAINIRPA